MPKVFTWAVAALLFVGAADWPPPTRRASPPVTRRDLLERLARAYYPGRTGQILLVPREGHIITRRDPTVKYMHGSPWDYDARIPFFLYGPRFLRRGTYSEPVSQQNMAPTLAALLNVAMPGTSTGRALTSVLKADAGSPRAIVLAVLDGMRADYLDRYALLLPTFSRLRREGASFTNAQVNYLPSITSLGHATIATGADPRVHGIVANSFFDRVAGKGTDSYPNLSPHLLMALTLSDVWNLKTNGRAVIIGQGTIARATLPLAGHGACQVNGRPVIAVSYDAERGGWGTNENCYRLPEYLKASNARRLWERANGLWMGHAIANPSEVRGSALFSSFEIDALNAMIERESVGVDDITDLAFVNLKTPDLVGHRYGPDSPEIQEALGALDRDIARLIAALDAKVGPDRYVVAFTADHGMPPEPDARAGGQRHYADDVIVSIHRRFDPEGRLVTHYEPENGQIAISPDRLSELGLGLERIAKFLEGLPYIFAAYAEEEVAGVIHTHY
jgi:type I phosphodiesterase/nucleotide pyrophosphatase